MQDAKLPKDEHMDSASSDGGTELFPGEVLQVKAPLATPSSKSPPDPVLQLWTQQGLKAHKADYFRTPGQGSSELVWSSPFADPPAQYFAEPDRHPQSEATPVAKFSSTRQPSLQDWCDGSVEVRGKRSRSAALPAQSLKLTPHGSPKLSRPGIPIFTPGAPKKPQRRSMGDVPLSELVSADSLSDLLSCDEDLGLSWGIVTSTRADEPFKRFSQDSFNETTGDGSLDSLSMKLLNRAEL